MTARASHGSESQPGDDVLARDRWVTGVVTRGDRDEFVERFMTVVSGVEFASLAGPYLSGEPSQPLRF